MGNTKLVPHLKEHKNYVVTLKVLQQAVELGVKITKLHRIVSYDQKAWMKPYIDHNVAKRCAAKKAGNKTMADYYKLANNSVFGKTMENVEKHREVQLCKETKKSYQVFFKRYIQRKCKI